MVRRHVAHGDPRTEIECHLHFATEFVGAEPVRLIDDEEVGNFHHA
jgi:hypothetical protein